VSAAYQTAPTPDVERFYNALLAWAGVTPPVSVSGAPIEARFLESGPDTTLLFLFNHGKEPSRSQVLLRRTAGAATAINLTDAAPISMRRTADGLTIATDLEPQGVRVLRIENE
jgi:hypothetical protein